VQDFSTRLIAWQKVHGRHDLPWQNTTDPYAIWVSEIMLQQTQVTAVVGYYAKFMQRFPTIASLAAATEDAVLKHWSGLGYYSRARNLRKAAMQIDELHAGKFPSEFELILSLPGIGRSTAAAIASFAFNQIHTILDGNVKRVLARHYCVEGWPGQPKVEQQLWQLAERLLPKDEMVAYTQGLMDLGATVCTRSKPKCADCPLNSSCEALRQNRVSSLPTPKPRKIMPEKDVAMLIVRYRDYVMLEKRPSSGIWGGLWSFPEVDVALNDAEIASALIEKYQLNGFLQTPLKMVNLSKLRHAFTHFKLHITPRKISLAALPNNSVGTFMPIADAINAAVPTPIRTLLLRLQRT
jgi:A/G-specific adenine glycosylase